MNDIIYDKLDEVLLTIRNNKKVIRMKELKNKIENDVDLKINLISFMKFGKMNIQKSMLI